MAHYTSALLGAMAALHPEDEWRVVLPRDGVPRPLSAGAEGPQNAVRGGVVGVRSRWPGRAQYVGAALLRRPRLDRLAGGCDVVWVPAAAPVAVSRRVPVVLTVHDRTWEERPADFTPYERLWHVATRPRALARRAAVVLTTTEYGRRDVVDTWGLDAARVRPVPLAPAVAPSPRAVDTADPYFLFVGALEPRKAPDVLLAAVDLARARGLRARVVVVGSGRVPVPGTEVLSSVTDAELSRLYAGALALVAPSRLEGFGLPAVEALACGTPAIVTDLPAVREVLGSRARFVAVDDAGALADALLEFETPQSVPPLTSLTWAATAQGTYAALRAAAAR
ncbi:MAG: hypothetical protein QOF76_1572 [Solirubrobacteraceae bacterium]|nr:hypothetical protein [Solirubrobacteraceae bacterium]